MPRGCRQAYCAKKLIGSPTPKPTSSPIQCFVWGNWEMILLRPGRAKLNGIRKTITSRIWIKSTGCRRSSSGKYSQESLRWASSRRFNNYWQICSVNLGTSKTGSSSCQCLTTPCGMEKETRHNVNTIRRQLRNMLANSLAVIRLSCGLDQKKNGTKPTPTNQKDPWIEGQNKCWQIFSIQSSNFSCLQCLCKRRITNQRREKKIASPHSDFSESAQYLRSNIRFVRRSTQTCQGSGETCSTQAFGKGGNPYRPLWGRKVLPMNSSGETYGKSTSEKFEQVSERPEFIHTVLWCGFEACRTRTILPYSWNTRRRTNATLMPRVHAASQWRGDSCKRMDSQEYEDRTSLEKKFAIMMNDTVSKFKFHLCFKTIPFLGSE